MTTSIFAADVKIMTGKTVTIFVATDELSHKTDIGTAAHEATKMPFGMFRLKNIRRSNRKALKNADPIWNCRGWAWIK